MACRQRELTPPSERPWWSIRWLASIVRSHGLAPILDCSTPVDNHPMTGGLYQRNDSVTTGLRGGWLIGLDIDQ